MHPAKTWNIREAAPAPSPRRESGSAMLSRCTLLVLNTSCGRLMLQLWDVARIGDVEIIESGKPSHGLVFFEFSECE